MNRHTIITSEGCIGFIMICTATIFTTRRTIETLMEMFEDLLEITYVLTWQGSEYHYSSIFNIQRKYLNRIIIS